MRARVPAFRQRDTRTHTHTTKRKRTKGLGGFIIVAHASLMDIPLAFARVSRFAFSGWCAKICVIDARRRKERPSSTVLVGCPCALLINTRRDDREFKKRAFETARQKPRHERRNARLEKKNVGRSPHPNVPERAFPREQVDGVEHDGLSRGV